MQDRLAALRAARAADDRDGSGSGSSDDGGGSSRRRPRKKKGDSDSVSDSDSDSASVSRGSSASSSYSDAEAGSAGSAAAPLTEEEKEVAAFMKQAQAITADIDKMKLNVRKLRELYDARLQGAGAAVLDDSGAAKASAELEKLVDSTTLTAQYVTKKLKDMDAANKRIPEEERGYANGRIRLNMHGTLSKQFVDVMRDFQGVQTAYRNADRDQFARRYRMVKKGATDEEIDAALEGDAGNILEREVLNIRHDKAKDAHRYVMQRHRDIVRLDEAIRDLHQLFVEMAVLVEAQGELIDHIEMNLESASNYTRKGVEELHKANDSAKSARKKMCCLIIFFVIVLAVLLGAVGGILGGTAGA